MAWPRRTAATPDSDYDLLVVVADDAPAEKIAPAATYALARAAHVAADVVARRRSSFERAKNQVGTLSYEAFHHGILVHGH
jgi:predicted nucleotidyltransferase